MKLGEWLVSKGRITEEQLARALQDKAFFNERLGSSLLKLGFIDEDTLGEYLADVARTRYCPPTRLEKVPAQVVAAVPARIAAKYLVMPIGIEARRLHLAMRDPKDLLALDEIAFLTGLSIEPFVATEFRIQQAIERYYNIKLGTKTIPVAGEPPGRAGRVVARPPTPPAHAGAAPGRPANAEMGLDGLPLDADPDDLDQPFVTATAAPPPRGPEEALPASLDAWRSAQEEAGSPPPRPVPIPEPEPAQPGRRAAVPGPVAAPAAVPARDSGPVTLESVALRLREADTRDDIFEAVLDFASTHFRRAALFVVQQDRVLGWSGRGEGLFPARIRNVILPLSQPSLFIFFRSGGDYFYGPVPDLPANAKFYLDLGVPPPARTFLLPLSIMGRTAVILYADNASESGRQPDIQLFRRLLQKASLALEVLILRNKLMML